MKVDNGAEFGRIGGGVCMEGDVMEDDDIYLKYFADIPKDLLSKEEEVALARRIAQGDEDARRRFIEANLKLVVYVVRKHFNNVTTISEIEMVQEGNLGLMHAVDMFDPDKGCRFATYAIWWIRQTIIRSLNSGTFVRLPHKIKQEVNRVMRVMHALDITEIPDKKSIERIAAECRKRYAKDSDRYTEKYVGELIGEYYRMYPLSLDDDTAATTGYEVCLYDLVKNEAAENPEDETNKDIRRKALLRALDRLADNERFVVMRRFGLDGAPRFTLEEVGRVLGVTRERVRQIEGKAIRKLRNVAFLEDLSEEIPSD